MSEAPSPRLVSHGGYCCGMKTIHSFKYGPDVVVFDPSTGPHKDGETYKDRFLATVKKQMTAQPEGCLELILAEKKIVLVGPVTQLIKGEGYSPQKRQEQYEAWKEAVEDIGFKETVSWINSNTGHRCHHFVLPYGMQNNPDVKKKLFPTVKKAQSKAAVFA